MNWYKILITIAILCAIWCLVVHADEIDDLIPCIIQVESGGDPNAVSSKGAIGLMQITPIVLEEWNTKPYNDKELIGGFFYKYIDNEYHGICGYYNVSDFKFLTKEDLFDEWVNISVGLWYLRRLRDYYLKDNYTLERLLCAWNGGITRLRKNNYDINKMPKETKDYVRKVMKLYKQQQKDWEDYI